MCVICGCPRFSYSEEKRLYLKYVYTAHFGSEERKTTFIVYSLLLNWHHIDSSLIQFDKQTGRWLPPKKNQFVIKLMWMTIWTPWIEDKRWFLCWFPHHKNINQYVLELIHQRCKMVVGMMGRVVARHISVVGSLRQWTLLVNTPNNY